MTHIPTEALRQHTAIVGKTGGGKTITAKGAIELVATLFDIAEIAARDRLLASGLGQLLPGEKVVDLFCGAGGWGAGAKPLGIVTDFAVNHSPVAIEYHSLNHPTCQHHQGDAWKARPRDVAGKATIGLLLASAACTTHSNARGAAPISPRVHMLGWCIARWIKETRPRCILVENVAEWQHWGPLRYKLVGGCRVRGGDGKLIREADPARKGQHFRKWIRYCKRLGYTVEFRILDAVGYGAASRRKRLFVMMRRDGQPIVWPEATHGSTTFDGAASCGREVGDRQSDRGRRGASRTTQLLDNEAICRHDGHGVRGRATANGRARVEGVGRPLIPYRTAASVIDWSDLGTSIFEGVLTKKGVPKQGSFLGTRLAEKTLARTCEGVYRYVLNRADPFTLRVSFADGWHVDAIDDPIRTQTGRQDMAVVSSVLQPQNTGVFGQDVEQPGPTITTHGHQSLSSVFLATTNYGERDGQRPRCNGVDETPHTAVNGITQGIGSLIMVGAGGSDYAGKPKAGDDSLNTVKCENRIGAGFPIMAKTCRHGDHSPIDGSAPTQTTCQDVGIGTPVMMTNKQGEKMWKGVDETTNTICAGGTHHVLTCPVLGEHYSNGSGLTGQSVDDSLGTIPTVHRHGIGSPILAGPMGPGMRERAKLVGAVLRHFLGDRITLNDEGMTLAVVRGVEYVIVDILFRMLRPHELAAAMGFPADYVWPKSQRDAVKLIGNAVAPPMATALLRAMFPAMWPRDEREEAAA